MENSMKSIAQRLEEHSSPTPSKWRELFDFLETNKSWLRHSQNIADAGQDGRIRNEPKAIG